MTREITREDIEFLKELQQELVTQDTCCQADPRFWVVREERWEVCWENEADRFALLEDGEVIGELREYRDDLPDGLCCVPERKARSIVPDTLFLTLRETCEYIDRNRTR